MEEESDSDSEVDEEEEAGPSRGGPKRVKRPKAPPERKRSREVNALRKEVSRLLESASAGKSSSFATGGELSAAPVIVIKIGKVFVYFKCTRAFLRSN